MKNSNTKTKLISTYKDITHYLKHNDRIKGLQPRQRWEMPLQTIIPRDDPDYDGSVCEFLALPLKLCNISCNDSLIFGRNSLAHVPASCGVYRRRIFWYPSIVVNKPDN